MSWRELAQYIPDPTNSSAKCGEADVPENKRRQLSEWRKGRRPKDETLKGFFRNAVGTDALGQGFLMQRDIAYGFDELCEKVRRDPRLQELEAEKLIVEVCGYYECYRSWAKDRVVHAGPPATS